MIRLDDDFDERIIGAALRLSKQQARVIKLFFRRPIVSRLDIQAYTSDVSVFMHRMRDRLSREHIFIANHYSLGYSLSPEGRDVLRAKLGRFIGALDEPAPTPPSRQMAS